MRIQTVQFSPGPRDQLAKLYNSCISGDLSRSEYQEIIGWLETGIVRPILAGHFMRLGMPTRRYLGLRTDQQKRIITHKGLARLVRVTATVDEAQEVVMIVDIEIDPPVSS